MAITAQPPPSQSAYKSLGVLMLVCLTPHPERPTRSYNAEMLLASCSIPAKIQNWRLHRNQSMALCIFILYNAYRASKAYNMTYLYYIHFGYLREFKNNKYVRYSCPRFNTALLSLVTEHAVTIFQQLRAN